MTTSSSERRSSPWAAGLATFAGILMIMSGFFQALTGLAAIINDQFFVVTRHYTYALDITRWGWIQLILGVIVGVAGCYILTGRALWARLVGITLAVVSATANFFFIPYYPIWSLLIIALDVFVIWALATYRYEDAV